VNQRKPNDKPKRLVWRMSENTPMGEWVDPDAPVGPAPATELPEVSHGGWVTSSFDLLRGADVSDDPDTVPDALWNELFGAPKAPPEASDD
jgi:hypothetical protein